MSWQEYVDKNLVGTGKVQKAVILGQKGGVWATSLGYKLAPEEQKAVVGAFSKPEAALASGIHLAGQKFIVFQCNDQHLYGKKGADGCVVVRTKQAILVAEYAHPIQAQEATPIVEGLAEYLVNAGY